MTEGQRVVLIVGQLLLAVGLAAFFVEWRSEERNVSWLPEGQPPALLLQLGSGKRTIGFEDNPTAQIDSISGIYARPGRSKTAAALGGVLIPAVLLLSAIYFTAGYSAEKLTAEPEDREAGVLKAVKSAAPPLGMEARVLGLDATWPRVLAIWWLVVWRSSIGALMAALLIGFLIGFVGELAGWPTQTKVLASIVSGWVAGLVCGLIAIRMALRKRYSDFRLSLIPRSSD